MGIPRGSARLLLEETKKNPFGGHVLQFGRSSVYFTQGELEDWSRRHRVELATVDQVRLSHDPRLRALSCIDDETLFRQLGFDRVSACDVESWEGAEYLFDLNQPIPDEFEGLFDVVFETGTIVQIFDLPQVMENVFRLLRPGGRVVHCAVPSNNHMDLGFYMLCPNFFADFYAANEWQVETHYLCEYYAYWHGGRLHSDPWKIYRYEPGMLDALSYGRYGAAQAANYLVARKTSDATGDRTPQLGQYRKTWTQFREADADEEERVAGLDLDSVGDREIAAPSRLHPTTRWLKRGAELVRRRLLPRPMPPVVMRL